MASSIEKDLQDGAGGGQTNHPVAPAEKDQTLSTSSTTAKDTAPISDTNCSYADVTAQNTTTKQHILLPGIKKFHPKSAFINDLKGHGLGSWTTKGLCDAISKTHKVDRVDHRKNVLHVIFFDEVTAQDALKQHFKFGDISLRLDPPIPLSSGGTLGQGAGGVKSPFEVVTLHLFGLPWAVENSDLDQFLQGENIRVLCQARFINVRGTTYKTPNRSLVVEVERGYSIPPLLIWKHDDFYGGKVRVRTWYPGMATYCRKCLKFGHSIQQCPDRKPSTFTYGEPDWENSRFRHYGDRDYEYLCAYYLGMTKPGEQSPPEPQGEVDWSVLPKGQEAVSNLEFMTELFNEIQKGETQTIYDKDVPPTLFSYRHPQNSWASNFYQGVPVTVWGSTYSCVEQFAGVWKSRLMGDEETAQLIMKETNPAIMKRLHGQVSWTGDAVHYTKVMGELLFLGNYAKYNANCPEGRQLMERLKQTGSSRLVEAVKAKSPWGCGMTSKEVNASNSDFWPSGCLNIFGDILGVIRRDVQREISPFSEIETAHPPRNEKRPAEESPVNSSATKKANEESEPFFSPNGGEN
jgi:ribA/ribD-fused uncharacterized protein